METNRLRFVDIDESAGLQRDTLISGFAVVRGSKGTAEPIYFPAGSEEQILARIGAPSKVYTGIQEVLDYNSRYSVWISSPPGILEGQSNYQGGVYVTTKGSVEAFQAVEDPENPNFLIKATAKNAGSPYSEGSTVSFSVGGFLVEDIPVLPLTGKVKTMKITYPSLADATVLTVCDLTLTGTDIMTTSGSPVKVGALTADTITITGNDTYAPLDFEDNTPLTNYLSSILASVVISWEIDIEEDVIMTLYQNSPRNTSTTFSVKEVDLSATIEGQVNPLLGSCKIYLKDSPYGTKTWERTYTLSPVYQAKDGFGSSIYIEDILSGNPYISGKAYKTFSDTEVGVTWPSAAIPGNINKITSGNRIITQTLTEGQLSASLLEGWNLISSNSELADVNLFMNVENTVEALAIFASLRGSTHPFSTFISGLKVGASDAAGAVTALKAISTPKLSGLAVYCNEFLVREAYSGTDYWTIPIGSIGKMLCNIMDAKLGGWAPMFTNTGEGLGGQLVKSVKKQKYSFSADQLDTLDAANINPVVLDIYYGLMITSQKTCQSPQLLTDWSFLGHQMAFDLFKKEVKKNVMIPQIGKPINNYYLETRQTQTQAILNRRLIGTTAIWDSGKVIVAEVNTAETKAANKFMIKVRIKVNPFSEEVELIFNNISQADSV